uniref:Uncharacterized protein n=1 Tax=Lepeophtheirus salmonis TaxID=72036 RepID=A0A0K2UE47_LEPSM
MSVDEDHILFGEIISRMAAPRDYYTIILIHAGWIGNKHTSKRSSKLIISSPSKISSILSIKLNH